MKRTSVSSTCLTSVGYDPRKRLLEVEFTHGDIYRYFDVPTAVHRALMAAESHGTFYQHQIRDAGYRYERLA